MSPSRRRARTQPRWSSSARPDCRQRVFGLVLRIQVLGLLATVVGDDRAELALGGRLEALCAGDGLVPVLLLLVDVDELAQRLHAVHGVLGQGLKDVFGAVEKPCAQVVLTKLEKRLAPLLGARDLPSMRL